MPATLRTTFGVVICGETLLTNPQFNKETAFSLQERREFGFNGRLLSKATTLDEPCRSVFLGVRFYLQFSWFDAQARRCFDQYRPSSRNIRLVNVVARDR